MDGKNGKTGAFLRFPLYSVQEITGNKKKKPGPSAIFFFWEIFEKVLQDSCHGRDYPL
jgi:hypothetical protein